MEKIKNILIILLIIIFTCSLVPNTFENDTFWTIALGEKILEHGVKLEEELVFHEGLKFENPRWLFDVIIAQIYNAFNFQGIYIFVLVMASLQALLYNYILNKITNKKELSFIITIIIMYFNVGEFAARGQIVSFLLFLLEFYALEQLLKSNKKIYSLLLVIIPILLVNVHASVYPMYFVFYLPYIAEFVVSKMKLKNETDSKIFTENNKIIKLIVLMLIGVLAGFCTPQGIHAHTYMLKTMEGSTGDGIAEMQSLGLFDSFGYTLIIVVTIGIIAFTKTNVRLRDCLFILGFALITHSAKRGLYFFYLISSICLVRVILDFWNLYDVKFNFISENVIKVSEGIICILILFTSIKNFSFKLTTQYLDTQMLPVEVTDYILENCDVANMRIFNAFDFGGYLEFRGIKPFIDSRAELFTEQFNEKCEILNDWRGVTHGGIRYKEIFEKYNITHAILNKGEIAYRYIIYDQDWKLIYDYGSFSLFEKVNK